MDPFYAATASTMAKPPNDGMGCYINAVLVAMFGANQPWLTKALTTPLVSDTGGVKALRQAVTAYGMDLRHQAHGGQAARPETIRQVLRAWPKLAPSLAQEAQSYASSSAGEFLNVLMDALVPNEEQLVHTRQEKLEWNDDHAVVAFDRYFRWMSTTSSPAGPMTSEALPAPSWSSAMFNDLSKRPATLVASKPQTSPYFAFGLSDFPEGSLVTLANVTHFSTLSTVTKPLFDFYLDGKPYRVKGTPILQGPPPPNLPLDALIKVAKDLLPSLQTGTMSQKMIHFLRQSVEGGSPTVLRVIEWLVAALGVSKGSSLKDRAHKEDNGEPKVILVLGLVMEALLLLGKRDMVTHLWNWAKKDFGDQDSWLLLDHLKACLDEVGQGAVYAAPGRLSGCMRSPDENPHWIFTTRTAFSLSASPSFREFTTGLVLSLTPSPGRCFAMVDRMEDHVASKIDLAKTPLVLTLPTSDPTQPLPMRLVGVVEYMGLKSRSQAATPRFGYGPQAHHQAAGHYRAWFWAGTSPSNRHHHWFVYDDLNGSKGALPIDPAHLVDAIKGWSAFGVAFFYVPLDTPDVPFDDTKAAAYRLAAMRSSASTLQTSIKSSPVTMVSPRPTSSPGRGAANQDGPQKRLYEFLAASPKALHRLKTASTASPQTPKESISAALAVLFPLVDEGSHPAWDIDKPTAALMASSDRWQQVQNHGLKDVAAYWGLKWADHALAVKDAPRFERTFVHAKDDYQGVARVLQSLRLMGRPKDQEALAYVVAQDLLSNASPSIRAKADFLKPYL